MMSNNLLKEWDYMKNEVDPTTLKRSSEYEAWWKCQTCKGSWQSKVKNRTNGSSCPYCAGRKVLKGFNDLACQYPALADQWIQSEHGLTPEDVTPGSHEEVTWKCEKGHHWKALVKTRVYGYGCPYCSKRFVVPNETDFSTRFPEIAKEWNFERNKHVNILSVAAGSKKKYWWKCATCGYEWQASPSTRTRKDRKKGCGCPVCHHKVVVPGVHDAESYNPEVASDWNVDLNEGKKLSSFLPASNRYGWWTCQTCGYTWRAKIQSRIVDNKGCPCCSGKVAVVGKTDLTTTRPDLLVEWNYERNSKLTPEQFTEFSGKRVWWKCKKCNYEWSAKIANRALGRGCPHCAPNRQE